MKKLLFAAIGFLFVLSFVLFLAEAQPVPQKKEFVRRVIDGDTLVLADGRRVRLTGIDSPEKEEQCFVEAQEFLKYLVSGKEIELEFDAEKRDKYARLLAYVFAEGKNVNLALVEQGYAVSFPFEPNMAFASEFAAAERSAREQGKGCLWERASETNNLQFEQ